VAALAVQVVLKHLVLLLAVVGQAALVTRLGRLAAHSKVGAVAVGLTLVLVVQVAQVAQQVEAGVAAHLQQPPQVLAALAATVLSALQLGKEQKCQTDTQSLKTVWWST
jgi:hypothetical protein